MRQRQWLAGVMWAATVWAAAAQEAAPNDAAKEDLKKTIEDQGIYLKTSQPGIVLSGYVDAGYTYGFQGGNTAVPDRKTVDEKPGSNFGLNALKLALEKPLPTTNDYAAGFRVDLIYGQDASIIDGSGNTAPSDGGFPNSSDFFLEQAFVQFNVPVGNGLKLEVGKFVSPLGYEVVERPSNMNISYGNLFTDITPTDHTGVLASYKFNSTVDMKAGLVDGINTSTATSYGSSTDGVGLLATVNLTSAGGNANLQNGLYLGLNPNANSAVATANLGDPNNGAPYALSRRALWVYDVWGQWKPKAAADKLTLAAEGDLGSYATSDIATGQDNATTWAGAGLYAKYEFTKIFSLASRVDWIHSDDGQKFANISTQFPNGSQDLYSATLTAEIHAWENMLLRGEYRLDWGQAATDLSPGTNVPTFTSTSASGSGPAQMIDLEVVYSF
jgi:hypothetical protein